MAGDADARSRQRACAALALLLVAHVALVLRVLPPGVVVSDRPVIGTDYALHATRALDAGRHFVPHLRLWGYDPFHVAGHVTGTVHDLDNKLAELWCGVVGPVAGYGRAFNLFLFAGFALIPAALYAAAAAVRLPPRARLVAAALASAAFHCDPYVANWTLFGGYAFILASAAAALVVARLARQVEQPSVRNALLLAATAPLFYIHGLTALLVAVLGLGLVPRALRCGGRGIAQTLGAVLAIVVVNWPWIGAMAGDWGVIAPSPPEAVERGTPFAGVLPYVPAHVWGFALPVVAGACGVWLLYRRGRRALALTYALGGTLFLLAAFEGTRLAWLRAMVEPPRLKVTLPFALAVPAAFALDAAWDALVRRLGALRAGLAVGVTVLVCAPWLLAPVATRAFGKARLRNALDPAVDTLFDRLATLGDPRGRIALEERGPLDGGDPPFKAYVAALGPSRTRRAWVGGPYYRGFTLHKAAQFTNGKLGGRPLEELDDAAVAAWFERYDVTGVAAVQEPTIARLRALPALLEESSEVAPYVLFRVRRDAQPCAVGDAEVRVDFDRIEVTPRSAEDVVLRLHHDRRLASDAGELLREDVPDDPVGFVRVRGHGGRPFVLSVR